MCPAAHARKASPSNETNAPMSNIRGVGRAKKINAAPHKKPSGTRQRCIHVPPLRLIGIDAKNQKRVNGFFIVFDPQPPSRARLRCPYKSILNTNAGGSPHDNRYHFVPRRYLRDEDCRCATTPSARIIRLLAYPQPPRYASDPYRLRRTRRLHAPTNSIPSKTVPPVEHGQRQTIGEQPRPVRVHPVRKSRENEYRNWTRVGRPACRIDRRSTILSANRRPDSRSRICRRYVPLLHELRFHVLV